MKYSLKDAVQEEGMQADEYRKRRVKRLKKYLILMFAVSVTVPFVLSLVLLGRVMSLGRTVKELTAQVEQLTEAVRLLQEDADARAMEEQDPDQSYARTGEAKQALAGRVLGQDASSGEADQADPSDQQSEPEAAHKVYLTFDDGPSIYTQDILDILDRYDVKATFFVVGKDTDSARESLKDIVERGHTLGMHSYSHKYSEVYASVDAFAEDFNRLRDYLKEVTGVESTVYRFPGGSSNTVSALDMEEYAEYLDSVEVRFFDWNISSGDGGSEKLTVEKLVKNSTADIESNKVSVILLHDSAEKKTTVEALPVIIENILAMEDTVILPITDATVPVQHIHRQTEEDDATKE
jgi:peptidoglycan/xylan/chitin deacetylase (PgdA/CDA1 family)